MSPSPETQDFLFFQESGDAEALARVFDRAAPRLLLLAGHFARDTAECEDLVQLTFLQALEGAESFDPKREVQPWLAGILRHRALDLIRKKRRRAEVAEPDEALAEHASSPPDAIAQRENYERLTQAIEDLDERYRDVLVLRLVHELEPASIARALGRSPSGVRTQCQRGLEKLRAALRGDRALLALLPLATGGLKTGEFTGLEVVREAVLREAATRAALLTPAATSAASIFIPTLTMKAALATLFLALAGLGLFALRSKNSSAADSAGLHPERPLASNQEKEILSPTTLESPNSSPAVAALPDQTERASLDLAPEVEGLEVRVRNSRGEPIEGAGLYLKEGRQSQLGTEKRTNASGIAHFSGPFGEAENVLLELHLDRAKKERFVYPNRKRIVEWILEDGQDVSGQVVDLQDEGVAGASVYRINQKHHDRMHLLTTTDSDGRFHVTNLVGELRFLARAQGYQPSEVERVRGDEVELQLGAFGVRVFGTVQDTGGKPVPHAWIAFGVDEDARENEDGSQRTPEAGDGDAKLDREGFFVRADENGQFETHECPRGHTVVLARSSADDERHLIGWHRQWITSDMATPIALRLDSGGSITGRLTGPSGEALEGYPFESQWEGGPEFGEIEDDLGQLFTKAACLTNEDGRYELNGLFPGEYDIRVVVGERSQEVRGELTLGLGEAATYDAVLSALGTLSIRLIDPEGQPLAGWRVRQAEAPTLSVLGFMDSRSNRNTRFDRETGLEGAVEFQSLEPGSQLIEFAAPEAMEGSVPVVIASRTLEATIEGEEVRVQLTEDEMPTASLEGQLHSRSGALLSEAVLVIARDEGHATEARLWCDEEGRFLARGLSAGAWRIHASKNAFGGRGDLLAEVQLAPMEHKDLGDLIDPARTTLRLTLQMQGDGDVGYPQLEMVVDGEQVSWWKEENQFVTTVLGEEGSAEVLVSGEGFAPLRVPMTWQDGETVDQKVDLVRGRLCRVMPVLTVDGTARSKDRALVLIEIEDERGLLCRERYSDRFSRMNEIKLYLLPGEYRMRVRDLTIEGGTEHEFGLTVENLSAPLTLDVGAMTSGR